MQRIIIIQDIAMKFHMLTSLVILISTSVTVANVLCSKTSTTWQQGVDNCLEDRGTPVSGKSLQLMEFKQEIHVWTSDYYVVSVNESLNNTQDRLCGFVYLPAESTQSEIFFSDCRNNRTVLCFQYWNNQWEVDSGPWNNARECRSWDNGWMYHAPNPGYYWSSETKKGLHHHLESRHGLAFSDKTVMCGAYNMEAGRYFRNCEVKLKSVCQSETGTNTTRHFEECQTDDVPAYLFTNSRRLDQAVSTASVVSRLTFHSPDMTSSQTLSQLYHLTPINSIKSEAPGTPEGPLAKRTHVNIVAVVAVATSLLVVAVITVLIFIQRRYGCIRLRPKGRPISMTVENTASAENCSFHANLAHENLTYITTDVSRRSTSEDDSCTYSVVQKPKHQKFPTINNISPLKAPHFQVKSNHQSNDVNHYSSVNKTKQIVMHNSENGQPSEYSFATENPGAREKVGRNE